ncbi:unnamed protein product [Paramecium pentaurelia]|uniref:Uncharacterized protein n=1 Tax=Paramecium pentaurelia TaxID=43138 RepID=A0A8S1UVN1_9CILI|nr:unnamed protein product [Paramecium pentaurelia]
MDKYYQIQKQLIVIDAINFCLEDYYFYGVWSKYNPLSPISQVCNIGLFDNNCFNIHNIDQNWLVQISFIMMVLIIIRNKLKKTIKFSDNEKNHDKFVIQMDLLEHENILSQKSKQELNFLKCLPEKILRKFPLKFMVSYLLLKEIDSNRINISSRRKEIILLSNIFLEKIYNMKFDFHTKLKAISNGEFRFLQLQVKYKLFNF